MKQITLFKLKSQIFFTIILILFSVQTACSGDAANQPVEPTAIVLKTQTSSPFPTSTPSPIPTDTPHPTTEAEDNEQIATPMLGEFIITRAPDPTATPGPIEREVIKWVTRTGKASQRILGLSVADWVNLGVSFVFVLLGYLLGTLIVRRLLPRMIKRAGFAYKDEILTISSDIRWFITLLVLSLSTERLTFVSAYIKTYLEDAYFIFGVYIVVRMLSKTVHLGTEIFRKKHFDAAHPGQIDPIAILFNRGSLLLIWVIGITVLLAHFGVNVSAVTAALGIGGLAFSLAARDTLADAIAGTIILLDQPFRIGDRIEIQGVGTWGDVVSIGLRSTRIRTRDNRMIIVPNSVISVNQIINYSYPDPRYRIETHVDIAYGSDVETVRRLIIDTVSKLDGVLPEKPVDALYVDMSGGAMRFRVRWWIESYVDTRRMFDRVHTALQYAFDNAGIVSPHISSNINLMVDQENADRVSQALNRNYKTRIREERIPPEQDDKDVDKE